MSNTQYIGGGVTQYVWRPQLIKLTAAAAKTFVEGSPVFIDPQAIIMVRRLPRDDDMLLEDVTYVFYYNNGIYVKETPEEVDRLRTAALLGDDPNKGLTLKAVE